ncbi:MAG: 3'-5' exonuclease [Lachnospiraceae bacterium]|nr:3'-5' exonuclease [Lachnospiraceae bacterium]
MENYVVLDLEMCKVPKKCRTKEFHWATETIQIGAVKLNEEYEVIDEFSTYVTPRFGALTRDITRLTGIHQSDLEGAPDIREAFELFHNWLPEDPVLVAWSETDFHQISYEVRGKDLDYGFLLRYKWIDCQDLFDKKVEAERNYSLENALNVSDINYRDGIHNGLVDAYNTALLFGKLQKDPDYPLNPYYVKLNADTQEEDHLSSSMGNLFAGLDLSGLK